MVESQSVARGVGYPPPVRGSGQRGGRRRAGPRLLPLYLESDEVVGFQGALAAGLPIGSGEIESAHRYIIQNRLKRAGAWWTLDNLDNMLALRVLRANREWEVYWSQDAQRAA